MKQPETTRINKYLAHAAGYSRREADDLVSRGLVKINNSTAAVGAQVRQNDIVTVNGHELENMTTYSYVLFHKPVGYVCSRRAQGDAPTIYELLPKQYQPLKTVGRLDKDSSGLILLTDDGDFAHRMTHPKFHKTKVYEVKLDHPLEPLHQQMINDYGIALEDGNSRFSISRMEPEAGVRSQVSRDNNISDRSHNQATANLDSYLTAPDSHLYEVTMQEGRNRQIRRTFAALGYTVTRLHRITFGPYSLGCLKPGHHEKTSAL